MKRVLLWWIIAVAILLILSTGWGLVWVFSHRDTVPQNTSVTTGSAQQSVSGSHVLQSDGRLPIGDLTIPDALFRLTNTAQAILDTPLTIDAPHTKVTTKTWTLGELGVQVDIRAAKAALSGLAEGSIISRALHRWNFPDELPIVITWNDRQFESSIRKQWGYIDQSKPVNAIRTISANDTVHYTPHQDAYRLNINELNKKAAAAAAAAWNDKWRRPDAKAALRFKLSVTALHPEYTLKRLKEQGIERMIASFSTDFSTSGTGRIHNVTAAAKTLHDWILAPGEVFDYGKVIEETRKQYGFQEAPVIVNGELVPGIGGGICQVSSTLYNAALYAGLSMTERRNHSLPVSYLPKGRDATFAEGAINFRFKNTTGRHLLIRTEIKDRSLIVKLFGTMPSNEQYKLDSKTVEIIPPAEKTITTSAVAIGQRRLLSTGKPGYIVETYRTLYRDGKPVSRQRISRDTYRAQPTVYGVAPGPGSKAGGEISQNNGGLKQKKVIEDGVSQ